MSSGTIGSPNIGADHAFKQMNKAKGGKFLSSESQPSDTVSGFCAFISLSSLCFSIAGSIAGRRDDRDHGLAQDNGQLSVRVADSCRGYAKQLGNGPGLANIRARLTALHGEAGRLRLAHNTPRGVTATISVPWVGTEAH